jgi:hypothetical protein
MMRRSRASFAVGIAASIMAVLPATAVAAGVDQKSDHAALAAYHVYLEGASARIPAVRKAESAYLSSISARCAGALAPLANVSTASANQTALFDFGEELGGSAFIAAYQQANGPFARLAATLGKLHWSSPQTARTVKRYLAAQRSLFVLAPSDVCTDAQALAASDAKTLPPRTAQWVAEYQGVAVAQEATARAFANVLERFEIPADRAVVVSDAGLLRSLTGKLHSVANSGATRLVAILGL